MIEVPLVYIDHYRCSIDPTSCHLTLCLNIPIPLRKKLFSVIIDVFAWEKENFNNLIEDSIHHIKVETPQGDILLESFMMLEAVIIINFLSRELNFRELSTHDGGLLELGSTSANG